MRRIAVDTNLLLLLVVGSASRSHIARHKRLRAYSIEDFDFLLEILRNTDEIVATPNAWTEVSNLAGFGLVDPIRSEVFAALANLINKLHERYRTSSSASEEPEFARLGLTDCAWLESSGSNTILLTDDLQLYLAACHRGMNAFNFTHLREQRGLL